MWCNWAVARLASGQLCTVCFSDVTVTVVQSVIWWKKSPVKPVEFWNVFPEIAVIKISQDDESSIRIHFFMLTDHVVQFF